jgi:cell division protein FtsB
MNIRTQKQSRSGKTMSQNPTLINGFDDVMTFIKQQEHRIKELEKENKKLEKDNNDTVGMFNFVVIQEEEKVKKIHELEEKNKELEEENEKLKRRE